MSFTLRDGISFCEVDGRLIFLDVDRDRYFCLSARGERSFRELLSGLRGVPEQLVDRGLIVECADRSQVRETIAPPMPGPFLQADSRGVTRGRYLLRHRWLAHSPTERADVLAFADAHPDFELAIDEVHLVVLVEHSVPVLRTDRHVLLGTPFDRGGRPATQDDIGAMLARDGESLIDHFWGGYIAVTFDGAGGWHLVRAPFGDLGCYIRLEPGGADVASDAAILRDCGIKLQVNWDAVARHLGRGDIAGPETCLSDIEEVAGGDRVAGGPNKSLARSAIWSPWHHADRPFATIDEACACVRNAVEVASAATTLGYDHIVLMLSGGLDSSILASTLSRAGVVTTCMTLSTGDLAGDERDCAEIVADHIGAPLVSIRRDAAAVDLTRSASAALPRPVARSFTQDSEQNAVQIALQCGARAIVDGGGGDNVFCSHRSVAAVADGILARSERPAVRSTAIALADLSDAGVPAVLARALRRAWFRPRSTRLPVDASLLSKRGAGLAVGRPIHPWPAAPPGALPGKAVHIALLAVAQAMIESTDAPGRIPVFSPLVAQVVVEACLRVPSMWWFAPGRDRALARLAFEADLPAAIINRRSKGVPNRYAASLIDRHKASIRGLLLEGALAGNDLLDTAAIRRLLDQPTPSLTFAFTRILQLVDAEAWARAWC